jgi:uncharacterized oxidoreductase
MKTSGNTILITGGGSGIGRELARRWHDMGNTVIVAGRTAASLRETAEGHDNIHTLTYDAANPHDTTRFAKELLDRFPKLNVLFNNAGIMKYEDVAGSRNLSDAEDEVITNLLGPIRLTDALVDHLKAQEGAMLVNTTSGLAYVPMPKAATYCATKAALHSYTVSLRHKLEGQIQVIELIPPGVQTELTPGQSHREGYMPLDDYIDAVMAQFEGGNPSAEITVPMSKMLRDAERDGRFDQTLDMLASR